MRHAAVVLLILIITPAAPALADPEPRSRYFFGMGFMVRKAPSELGSLRGTPYVARSLEQPRAQFDHDVGLRWRAGLVLRSPVYLAIDAGVGMTDFPDGQHASAPLRTASAATLLAVTGVRGEAGATVLGVELAAGFRHVTYCIGESAERHDVYTSARPIAELRARGEVRLGSSARLGVTAGTSLLDQGAWIGAVDVTFVPR